MYQDDEETKIAMEWYHFSESSLNQEATQKYIYHSDRFSGLLLFFGQRVIRNNHEKYKRRLKKN